MKLKKMLIAIGIAASCLLTGCSKVSPGNTGIVLELQDGDKIAEINIEGYGTIKAKLFPDIAPNAVENFIQLAESGYYEGLKIHRVAKDASTGANLCIQGGSLNGDGTGGDALINAAGYFANEISLDARHFYGALCTVNIDGENATQFYVVTSQMISDIGKLSPELIRAEAAKFTAAKEGMEEYNPDYAPLAAQEAYYTNLADMMEKASVDIQIKYASGQGGYPMWDGLDTVFGQVFDSDDVIKALCEAEVTTSSTGEISKPVQDIVITSVVITEYVTPEPVEEEETSSKKK